MSRDKGYNDMLRSKKDFVWGFFTWTAQTEGRVAGRCKGDSLGLLWFQVEQSLL